MFKESQELERRKRALLARSAVLRIQLARDARPLMHNLQAMESGVLFARRVLQHPEWLAAGAFTLALIGPRRLSGWLRGLSSGLRLSRLAAPLLQALRAH